MYITATQIREGMVLKIEDELYIVTWRFHRTPGKGDACIQTKLKNISSGKNMEYRFRSSDKAEKADLETKEMQYLYKDDSGFVFMDNETYDQHILSEELIGESAKFLNEGVNFCITFYQETPVGLELPRTMDLKVVSAPPEIRKATASSSLRPVTLENDIVVQAPAFIKEGNVIRVTTENLEYVERV